jgi:hypothetical protein
MRATTSSRSRHGRRWGGTRLHHGSRDEERPPGYACSPPGCEASDLRSTSTPPGWARWSPRRPSSRPHGGDGGLAAYAARTPTARCAGSESWGRAANASCSQSAPSTSSPAGTVRSSWPEIHRVLRVNGATSRARRPVIGVRADRLFLGPLPANARNATCPSLRAATAAGLPVVELRRSTLPHGIAISARWSPAARVWWVPDFAVNAMRIGRELTDRSPTAVRRMTRPATSSRRSDPRARGSRVEDLDRPSLGLVGVRVRRTPGAFRCRARSWHRDLPRRTPSGSRARRVRRSVDHQCRRRDPLQLNVVMSRTAGCRCRSRSGVPPSAPQSAQPDHEVLPALAMTCDAFLEHRLAEQPPRTGRR